jgi:hypothetical protein
MEEIIKLIAAGGGIGVSATWAYWLWRLEPRFKALEEAVLIQSKVDLLRIATSSHVAPQLKEIAQDITKAVDEKLAVLK